MTAKPRVLVVFGTRPEASKMAPVVWEIRKSSKLEVRVCVTGQHRQMLDQMLRLFGIVPDVDLDIMAAGQDLFDVTARTLTGMRRVLQELQPSLVLVQGDTTSGFAAALAAYYAQVPVGHVEAGLRTGDKLRPFPEEINRKLVGAIADLHFAPTRQARENLLAEGVPSESVSVTGNTVVDALLWMVERQRSEAVAVGVRETLRAQGIDPGLLESGRRLILVTGHRRESFGGGIQGICEAVQEIAMSRPESLLVYPVHLNPNVQEPVNRILGGISNVILCSPLGYEPFVYLMSRSYLVLTDSGGLQEEAPTLRKPVLVMRDTTERPEGVAAGVAELVGTRPERIVASVLALLDDPERHSRMSTAKSPYGDGTASSQIIAVVERFVTREVPVPSV